MSRNYSNRSSYQYQEKDKERPSSSQGRYREKYGSQSGYHQGSQKHQTSNQPSHYSQSNENDTDSNIQVNPETEKRVLSNLHIQVRILLNVQESVQRRLQSVQTIRAMLKDHDAELIVRKTFDKLLATLEQVLIDKNLTIRNEVAILLGSLGAILKFDCHKFGRWALNNIANAPKDAKYSYLVVLRQFLMDVPEYRHIQGIMLPTFQKMQTLLEEMQAYDLIIPVLEIVQLIHKHNRQIIKSSFHDVVDLLVGIRLDTTLPEEASPAIQATFDQLGSLWSEDYAFTADLLEKFVTDMCDIANTLQNISEADLERRVIRLQSFIACFTGIVLKLNGFAKQALAIIPKLLNCFKTVLTVSSAQSWLLEANRCLAVLSQLLGNQYSSYYSAVLSFMLTELGPPESIPTNTLLLNILENHEKILRNQGSTFPVLAVSKVLYKLLGAVRLNTSPAMKEAVSANYSILLNQQNVGDVVVQHTAKNILDEIEALYIALSQTGSSPVQKTPKLNLSQVSPYLQHPQSMLTVLQFDLTALGEMKSDNVKSVDYITETLVTQCFPFAKCVCSLGQNFQVNQVIASQETLQLAVVQTLKKLCLPKEHFSKFILPMCVECYSINNGYIMNVGLEWMAQALSALSTTNSKLQITEEETICLLTVLMAQSKHKSWKVRHQIGHILKLFVEQAVLTPQQVATVASAAIFRLGDATELVRGQFYDVLMSLEPLFPSSSRSIWKHDIYELSKGGFRNPHFQRFMHFMAQRNSGAAPSHSGISKDDLWLHDALIFSHPGKDVSLYSFNSMALTYWGCLEAVKWLILSRLKSSFGGPAQTFEGIERLLIHTASLENLVRSGLAPGHTWKHLPARIVIQFIEELERQIQLFFDTLPPSGHIPQLMPNTYHNNMWELLFQPNSFPTISSNEKMNTVLFFKTNKKVCEEWVNRFRPNLVVASSVVGSAQQTIRNAVQRVSDLLAFLPSSKDAEKRRIINEVDSTLIQLAMALGTVGDRDFLEGLDQWSKNDVTTNLKFTGNFVWTYPFLLQSKGRYEAAVAEYKQLLKVDDLASYDPFLVDFVVNQVTDCYAKLCDWENLDTWVEELREYRNKFSNSNIKNSFMIHKYDTSYLRALAKYDSGDYTAARNTLDLTIPANTEAWSVLPSSRIHQSEQLLLQSLLLFRVGANPHEATGTTSSRVRELLTQSQAVIEEPIRLLMMETSQESLPYMLQLNCIKDVKQYVAGQPNTTFPSKPPRDVGLCNTLLRITKLQGNEAKQSTVLTAMAKAARKSLNFNLCQKLLAQLKPSLETSFEACKLEYSRGNTIPALSQLANLCHTGLTDNPLATKVMRKLTTWLSKTTNLQQLEGQLRAVAGVDLSVPLPDITGLLLTKLAATDAQAWLPVADWNYRQGQKFLQRLGSKKTETESILTDAELEQLKTIVSKNQLKPALDSAEWAACVKTLSNNIIHNLTESDNMLFVEESPDLDQTEKEFAVLSIKNLFAGIQKTALDELLSFWFAVRKRLLKYYDEAVNALFNFIQLEQDSQNTQSVIVTLKLFRLLMKFGADLDGTFSSRFASCTNFNLWKFITPQLFARLGHPDNFVRNQLVELIIKIGKESPHAVLYPTLVALNSRTSSPKYQLQQILSAMRAHNSELVQEAEILLRELARINLLWEEQWLIELQRVQEQVYSKLRLWKVEAQEYTLIVPVQSPSQAKNAKNAPKKPANPEEASSPSTAKNAPRVTANLTNANKENAVKMMIKYHEIAVQALAPLESLYQETCRPPETLHEKWFHQTYLHQLKKLVCSLSSLVTKTENPEALSPDTFLNPDTPYHILKETTKEFNRFMKPSALKLTDISPKLLQFQFKHTPVPGSTTGVNIRSFDQNVAILPTKTRPKKLAILGTDGIRYQFLLKGTEDLRLDERMMQFLNITNHLLKNDEEARKRNLKARTYAVIPLSDRSGLIQWVDRAVPLFTLYKQWQRKELAYATPLNQPNAPNQPPPPESKPHTLLRPSDAYYAKLVPAFQERGITVTTGNTVMTPNLSRKDWPKDILRKVFLDLQAESPKTLISRELWLTSQDSWDWWQKSQTFSRSTAVMSMLGYLIGLGDRHLDNILLDTDSGEIVHIDFNVCFEKGLKLRVPERVPFRLSQCMMQALGFTGTRGYFETAARNTLRVLRSHKELLMTVLEVFVYDPLTDWTTDSVKKFKPLPREEEKKSKSGEMATQEGSDLDSSDEDEEKESEEPSESESNSDYENESSNEEASDSNQLTGSDNKPVHDRNIHGIRVLKRVAEKLNGADFGMASLSVQDQVSMLLKQARDIDNLCTLYEGWTAWI